VRSPELDSPQFINDDTVAYLQNGNLSLYNLAAEEQKALLTDNDVTAFAWSEKGHQQSVLFSDPSNGIRQHIWLPDDRWLLVVRAGPALHNMINDVLWEAIPVTK
jgi:hypothetical protein